MDLDNHYKNLESLSKQLEELQRLQNQAFASLDAKTYEAVKEQHIDLNDIMRKFREGDYKAIDNYLLKYNKTDAGNSKK
tara:strand:+ start:1175 stop:1411 length:237 start_codon:yes stop_codon:yes gene_type:complete